MSSTEASSSVTPDYKLRTTIREFFEFSVKLMRRNEEINERHQISYSLYPSVKLYLLLGLLDTISIDVLRQYYIDAFIHHNNVLVKEHSWTLFTKHCIYILTGISDAKLLMTEWTSILANCIQQADMVWSYVDTIVDLLTV